MTFVTIEDDNSEHLISHDELDASTNSVKKKKESIFQQDSVKPIVPIPIRKINWEVLGLCF